jgi:hypothetical protein
LSHAHIICITVWENRNNHCQECARAYLSIHDCLSYRHEVMIGNYWNKTTKS